MMSQPPDDATVKAWLRSLVESDAVDSEDFELLVALANKALETNGTAKRFANATADASQLLSRTWTVIWTRNPVGEFIGDCHSRRGDSATVILYAPDDIKRLLEVTGIPDDLQPTAIGRVIAPNAPKPVSVQFSAPPSWAVKEIRPATDETSEAFPPSVYQLAASGGSEPVRMSEYLPSGDGAVIATFHDDPTTGKVIELDIVTDNEWHGLYVVEVAGLGDEPVTERVDMTPIDEPKKVPQLVSDVIDELELRNACHGVSIIPLDEPVSQNISVTLRPLTSSEIADHLFESVVGLHSRDMQQEELSVEREGGRFVVNGPACQRFLSSIADQNTVYYMQLAQKTAQ